MDNLKKAVERKLGEDNELGDKMGRGLLMGSQELTNPPAGNTKFRGQLRPRVIGDS